MNEPLYTDTDEFFIDLEDLFFFLLKKWRSLLVLILVGAVLGGTLSGLRTIQPDTYTQEELVQLEAAMPNFEQARRYRNIYTQLLAYQEESPTMHLDPGSVYVGKVIYAIQAEEGLEAILAQYENLLTPALAQQLQTASEMDFQLQYITELYGSWSYIQEAVNNTSEELITNIDCMVFQVEAPSKKACEAMLDVIRSALHELDTSLSQSHPLYSARKISDTILQADPNSYIAHQESQAARLNTSRTNMQNLEKSFSPLEKTYYAEMLHLETEEQPASCLKPIIKGIILGAFLTCCLWGGWFLLRYLTDKHIKTSEEAQMLSRVPNLGTLPGQPKDTGIDQLIQRLRRQKKIFAADYLSEVAANLSSEPVFLCGDETRESICTAQALLHQHNGNLIPAPMPTAGREAFIRLRSQGQAIFLIHLGQTSRQELTEAMELCRLQSIPVLGLICIQ